MSFMAAFLVVVFGLVSMTTLGSRRSSFVCRFVAPFVLLRVLGGVFVVWRLGRCGRLVIGPPLFVGSRDVSATSCVWLIGVGSGFVGFWLVACFGSIFVIGICFVEGRLG